MKRLAVAGVVSLLMVVALLGLMATFQSRALAAPLTEVAPDVVAAPQAVAVSIDAAPTALPADTTLDDCSTGTPYAIHVTTTGLDAGLSYYIKAYHYSASDGNINRGCMWNWQTNSWTVITNTYTGLPSIGGVASWSGWIYLKEVSNHAGFTDVKLRVRFRTTGGVNVGDGTLSPTAYNTTSGGGWISGHAYRSGSVASGAPVIVRNGSAIVGIYATEDNAVNDGYASGDTGYYKVAAPVGSNYTAEVWDSANILTGTTAGGITVAANATTANVDINVPDGTPPHVSSTTPISNATDVSPYQPLTAVFNEALNPATVNGATFTLTDGANTVTGTVTYDVNAWSATFTPDSSLAGTTRFTATLTAGIQDLAGNPLDTYTWSFTTGAADHTPPTVLSHYPATNAISVPLNSSIVITFSEDLKPSTVTAGNFTLVGPQGSIGWNSVAYDAATDRVILSPSALVPQARHTVTISSGVTDWANNAITATTWAFTTSAELPYRAYFGDLHNHTSYSDGSLTAAQAYATGRAAGFDFMAVTDHSYAVDDSEWANMLTAANNATIDGVFVALRGVEYTQGAEGHINVINTVRHAVRSNTGCTYCDYTPNLEKGVTVDGFYNWLSLTGTLGLNGESTIAQFNHPGWINFNDWTFHPEVSPTMKLEEVGNGSGTSYVFSEDEYIRSLDYGWKLGATNNADTHSPFWGSNTDHRTGVWLTSLTKADLMAALQARRTFATEDKNYALGVKANGFWMGTDITNTGTLAFDVTGSDADHEGAVTVQMITFGGEIVTQTQFASSDFNWQPIVPVTPGEHYYYIKITQTDGDRIVSSPIWAHSVIDVSLTDLTIEPTIASIYNPSLITARVTNRMATTQTVTVTFSIPNFAPQVMTATAPACVKGPCVDGYASISWQPVVTGPVTITAQITGTPAGDNLQDNTRSTVMDVTDEHLPLILIDAAHGNTNALGREMRMFVKDLSDHRYNVLKQLTPFTLSALNTDTVKLLVITAPETAFTPAEMDAIAEYAATGGSLWICNLADYTGKVGWASTVADRLNALVDRIETRIGQPINMRMNDDEVIDANTNNGYVFGVEPGSFPSSVATGIGVNVESISTWSLGSIRGRLVTQPITSGTPGVQIVVQGDLDAGYGPAPWHDAYHTYNTDSDGGADAYIYNPTWVYPATQPAGAIPLPLAAATQLPNGGGRLLLYGDSNDGFGTFAYTAGDGKQNELFNLETVMWLLGEPITKSTVAQARAAATLNQPDKLNRLVWVEGKITAAFGEFFNVLYIEDETGGITIHAPAGDISATQYSRGAYVRVLGTIDIYQGDTEVEFFEAEQVQVITPTNNIDPVPHPLSTHDAALENSQGWLTQITGTVTLKDGESIYVDDGSGPVRAFLDGYNGTWADVHVLDQVTVKGLISEDYAGNRIRVRNYQMHYPAIPNDVTILAPGLNFSGSTAAAAPLVVAGGQLITYTLTVSNSGGVGGSFLVTDTLDSNVSLVSAPGMTVTGPVLTAQQTVAAHATSNVVITVRANFGYSGTISNTAQLSGDGSLYDLTSTAVQVNAAYGVYLPMVRK